MSACVEINLFGSLQKLFKETKTDPLQLKLENPTEIVEIIQQLRIPKDRVQMVMVNHKAVGTDRVVNPGDRIALFPMEYPLFADWLHFRIK